MEYVEVHFNGLRIYAFLTTTTAATGGHLDANQTQANNVIDISK